MPPKGISNTKAFKPPSRTANTGAGVSKSRKPNANSESRSKSTTPRRALSPSVSLRGSSDVSSETENDEVPPSDDEQNLVTPQRVPATTKSKRKASTMSPAQTIPADLLRTLIQHHFRDKSMKVSGEASLLVSKYMDTFVREAIARAAFERGEVDGQKANGRDFLEVENLEKLAPQLLMDF